MSKISKHVIAGLISFSAWFYFVFVSGYFGVNVFRKLKTPFEKPAWGLLHLEDYGYAPVSLFVLICTFLTYFIIYQLLKLSFPHKSK